MTQPFDIAIVLGAAVTADGHALPPLRRRVAHAVSLHQAGLVGRLLLSGGGRGAVSEAEAMRRLAMDAGVAAAALLIEDRSCSTVENAVYSLRLLRAERPGRLLPGRLLIVSDRYHLPRALHIFRHLGADAVGSAPPPPSSWAHCRGLLREAAAIPLTLWRLRQLPHRVADHASGHTDQW